MILRAFPAFHAVLMSVLAVSAHAGMELRFQARTVAGEQFVLAGQATTDSSGRQLTVVCFLGAECPMARLYGPRLSQLATEFRDRGVRVVGINSNSQDSYQDVRSYVEELGISYPFIHDKGNVIADQFGATRTPEAFLLDDELEIRYHGRIDDQYEPGVNRAAPSRRDLRLAIEELLAGKPVSVPATTATGCVIGRVRQRKSAPTVSNDITYSQHVVPVLQRNCVECHRAGDIGPFAMESYAEAAGWADTMLETIENGRMPPWHADPQFGSFANERQMTEEDKQIVRDWVAGGLKEGDPRDVPASVDYVDGWQLERAPDQIVAMRDRPFVVPADGVVEYQYFVADPGFTEDKWISAAQVFPGQRSVVHHAIVFVRPPDGSRFRGIGWLSAYVPGQRMVPLPPGRARKIPAGSKLVFQMHYTPNGKIQEDITKVGILFAEEQDVTHEVFTLIGINQEFEIPPNRARHVVKAKVPWLPEHAELLAATPHMHYRGKSFRLFSGDRDPETLLSVPNYDFNWQHTYVFNDPLPMSRLDSLHFEATFDNSEQNPFNPDPKQWVTWGDQTWEEMAVAFFEISEPRRVPGTKAGRSADAPAQDTAEREQKIDAFVARALRKMDRNQDGQIAKSEAPTVVRHFNFWRFDLNRDEIATKDELRSVAESIYSNE